MVFMLVFFALQFNKHKGIGEHDFIKIDTIIANSTDIKGDLSSLDYYPLVMQKNKIIMYHYVRSRSLKIGEFKNVNKLINSKHFNKKNFYVIYEIEKSSLFSEAIRIFSKKNIPIFLASISK
jgi:hypothetical protein